MQVTPPTFTEANTYTFHRHIQISLPELTALLSAVTGRKVPENAIVTVYGDRIDVRWDESGDLKHG